MIRCLLLLTILALTASCIGRPPEDATGQEIYLQLCSNCHASDLSGGNVGPPLGSGSNSAQQPDEFLRVTIRDGRGRMPSFSSSLDDDQLNRLVLYIRAEQGQ